MGSPSLRLALGAVCIAFAPILVKCVSLGPTPVGLYRCAIGSLLLLAWSFRKPVVAPPVRTRKKSFVFALLLAGLLFAADLAVWHRSVIWAGAGLGTILGNTQVIYLGLIGLLWHRERLTWRYLLAVPLAFVGVYALVGVDTEIARDEHYWWGVGCGLLTGAIYASFLMTMRWLESTRPGHGTSRMLGCVLVVSSLSLFCLSLAEDSLRWPVSIEWLWLALLSVGPQVVGWILITRSLPQVPVSRSGLILLLQPVFAVILGALIFQERMSGLQVGGAVITLVALYMGATRQARE